MADDISNHTQILLVPAWIVINTSGETFQEGRVFAEVLKESFVNGAMSRDALLGKKPS